MSDLNRPDDEPEPEPPPRAKRLPGSPFAPVEPVVSFAYGGRPPFVAGDDTSEAAADSIEASAATLRGEVLRFVRAQTHVPAFGGATCDEIEQALGLRHQTASARCRELVLSGHLIRTDRRRKTRSGRAAAVLVAR